MRWEWEMEIGWHIWFIEWTFSMNELFLHLTSSSPNDKAFLYRHSSYTIQKKLETLRITTATSSQALKKFIIFFYHNYPRFIPLTSFDILCNNKQTRQWKFRRNLDLRVYFFCSRFLDEITLKKKRLFCISSRRKKSFSWWWLKRISGKLWISQKLVWNLNKNIGYRRVFCHQMLIESMVRKLDS